MTKVNLNGEDVNVEMTEEEFKTVKELLHKVPNITELGMFDVMWSEHCSYKSSRPKLKFFEDAEQNYDYVLAGPGEDAGVIDIGDGYVLAFRIESHNHPSAIEPYHGAATGIGGIIRDILCMGVRPIALLDPLRFGRLKDNSHSQWLFKYVVKGIADYGNCTGIPTIGGEVQFDDSFESNCLVNVACIGLGTKEDFEHAPSKAYHPGDYVIIMGGSTGRDGIHGVTFASRTLTEMSEADRPAVQIGDPFTKKMIIEATLEAVKSGYVRGLKDLGGGGLTCATSELTGGGDTGANIDLRKIMTREPGMNSYEIMLSESQERMAFIVKPEGLEEVLEVFNKYEMSYAVIGRTNDSKVLKAYDGEQLVVSIPSKALSESPTFKREEKRPHYLDKLLAEKTPHPDMKMDEILYKLIASENISSKEWVYRQYDHEVGIRSIIKCGEGDSGVLRIIGTNKFIAASVGVNSKHCFLDPYEGVKGGLVEQCSNVIANGAKPMAMVNCCNFGNPEIAESFWYFSKAVDGMNDFCRLLRIPIVGGNVSFYNEDEVKHTAIKATPTIMIVGLINGQESIVTLPFKKVGNDILIIGETYAELGGSEYHSVIYDMEGGKPPKVNEELIKKRWEYLFELYEHNYVKAIHDVDKGGFIITIVEMCLKNKLGARINIEKYNIHNLRDDELLFSESVGRFVIETDPADNYEIMHLAENYGVLVKKIGTITDLPEISISGMQTEQIKLDLKKLKMLYESTIPNMMDIYNIRDKFMNNLEDRLQEYCGVFGVVSKDFSYSIAGLIYAGLMAIQHRGQLFAGIAVTSCEGAIDLFKGKGLVSKVLEPKVLRSFIGNVGIGHICYGSPYCTNEESAQPYLYKSNDLEFSTALNGRIINPKQIQDFLEKRGRILITISDIELIACLISTYYESSKNLADALKKMMKLVRGAYSLLLMTRNGDIYAIRDSNGYKPLCFGSLNKDDKIFHVFASESCALDVIGAKLIDDVKPGEIVHVNPQSTIKREQVLPHLNHGICSYEYIYFARPDSIIDGVSVGQVRYNLGINLAINDNISPENAIVVPIPDSGRSAAMGYSWKSKIPYEEGLMKNRYIWQLKRDVNEKLNPVKAIVYNKDIVLIDDSIVSGVTMKKIIQMLRDVGAKSIHVRISCPPLIKNCDLNDTLPNRDIFIALETKKRNFDNFNEEMREYIDADSLKYQTFENLIDAIGKNENEICSICLKEICDINEEILRNK